jgi:hypothetical protein
MAKTMQLDEGKWPELTAFRDACLDGDIEAMSVIAQ